MTLPSRRRRPHTLALTLCAVVLGLVLAGGLAAHAQEDPIAALLDKAAPATPAAAEPPASVAPAPVAPAPVAPPSPAPPSPAPASLAPEAPAAAPPRAPRPPPALSGPTRIEETGKAPDGPPSPTDLYFESRVRQSFAAAQGLQGPLDGHWVVRAGGAELYDLQLVDKNQGSVEGAWRDPRRRGAADASGFIETIQRTGGELTVRFQIHAGEEPVQLALRQAGDAWTGELTEHGARRPVTVRRN